MPLNSIGPRRVKVLIQDAYRDAVIDHLYALPLLFQLLRHIMERGFSQIGI